MTPDEEQALQNALDLIHNDPNYRVQTRLTLPEPADATNAVNTRQGAFLSIDTNGVDPMLNDIVRLSIQQFTYIFETSQIISTPPLIVELNEPDEFPITPFITSINGVTPELVKGHKLNTTFLTELLTNTDIIVSQQARFARPFLEKHVPVTKEKAWACLTEDLNWRAHGLTTKPTMSALISHFGFFLGDDLTNPTFAGKPAEAIAGVTILSQPMNIDDAPVLTHLRQAAGTKTYRILVPSDWGGRILKNRGYKFRGSEALPQVQGWFIDVPQDQLDAEFTWLDTYVYKGTYTRDYKEITAFNRHSRAANI